MLAQQQPYLPQALHCPTDTAGICPLLEGIRIVYGNNATAFLPSETRVGCKSAGHTCTAPLTHALRPAVHAPSPAARLLVHRSLCARLPEQHVWRGPRPGSAVPREPRRAAPRAHQVCGKEGGCLCRSAAAQPPPATVLPPPLPCRVLSTVCACALQGGHWRGAQGIRRFRWCAHPLQPGSHGRLPILPHSMPTPGHLRIACLTYRPAVVDLTTC